MLNEYPKFEKGQIEEFYNSLSEAEQSQIEKYMVYRMGRGLKDKQTLANTRRMILQLRFILEKPLNKISLDELRALLSIVNNSELKNHTKNNVKINLKNFLKYAVRDWSFKFCNLEDISTNGIGKKDEERINHNTLFSKQDVEKMLKAEFKPKWRAFLLLQYEAGLRTKETRFLKWSDLKIDIEDGLTEVNIYATKTKKARAIYVKEATQYIKLWKEEQENKDDKGIYIFHMRHDKNRPIAKFSVNEWFRKLAKRALGREGWNYLLRHSRGTELYKLANENKISKDTAIKFMGHSSDMSETYTHLNPSDVKKMLKDQVYNISLTEDKKTELEKKIERQENLIKLILQHLDKDALTEEYFS